MSPDEKDFLMVRERIARYALNQTALALGFQVHDIPVLVAARLLVPLGRPAPNAPKYFARCEIEILANDRKWLDKATDAIYRHWRGKNQKKRSSGRAEDREPVSLRPEEWNTP